MNKRHQKNDEIWKALADGTRRQILDVLAERSQSTGELVSRFDHLCRTNVMKHLEILVAVNLVVVRWEGRTRWNYLNSAPIQSVCDRWVSKHVKQMASAMSRLKEHVEDRHLHESGQNKKHRSKTGNKSKAIRESNKKANNKS